VLLAKNITSLFAGVNHTVTTPLGLTTIELKTENLARSQELHSWLDQFSGEAPWLENPHKGVVHLAGAIRVYDHWPMKEKRGT
jgi:hypothetical protein